MNCFTSVIILNQFLLGNMKNWGLNYLMAVELQATFLSIAIGIYRMSQKAGTFLFFFFFFFLYQEVILGSKQPFNSNSLTNNLYYYLFSHAHEVLRWNKFLYSSLSAYSSVLLLILVNKWFLVHWKHTMLWTTASPSRIKF